jgi:hypothetical protein
MTVFAFFAMKIPPKLVPRPPAFHLFFFARMMAAVQL